MSMQLKLLLFCYDYYNKNTLLYVTYKKVNYRFGLV